MGKLSRDVAEAFASALRATDRHPIPLLPIVVEGVDTQGRSITSSGGRGSIVYVDTQPLKLSLITSCVKYTTCRVFFALPFPPIYETQTSMEQTMDAPNFTSFIAEERARIKEAIKAAKAKRQEAEGEIAQLEAQVAAIAAYDAALKGTKAAPKPRAPRGRRGEKRQAILDLIARHPDGITRHELIDEMHAHGDKAAEQSISNALSALKKAGHVTQEGKRYIVRTEPQPAPSYAREEL